MKNLPFLLVLAACAPAWARTVTNRHVVCTHYEAGTSLPFSAWAPDDLKDGQGAVYVFLERGLGSARTAERLMKRGAIPPGVCICAVPGSQPAGGSWGQASNNMRAEEYDQIGTEFPSALVEDLVPAAERALGKTVSRDPNLHFITGASSGGIAAFNACWYRNDFFRRCYCNSPTFSNIRQGNQLMPLVRKAEARPIRVWMSAGTDEPDYYFGDSYCVALDAVSALRFAGYEVRFDRFAGEGHGAHYRDDAYLEKVLAWLFADWRTKPVAAPANPLRVRHLVAKDQGWTPCDRALPPPVRAMRSLDDTRLLTVSPTNRFVLATDDRLRVTRLAPLELAWNVSAPGGFALALCADGRLLVATELGVQGVVPFGITDLVLPLPGDLPCDNVYVEGATLYAASGTRVFARPLRVAAAAPTKPARPTAPGYGDGFWYGRTHEPAGGVAELLGSYVTAGRVAGVISVLSDADYRETYDCAGFANIEKKARMRPDTLFAVFSMSKTFLGAAMMCAIDAGQIALDDPVAKFLPEFADVKMKDGSKPKRPLTVRDLTCHVSGYRCDYPLVNRDLPLREVARWLAAQPLEAQPGETFSYRTTAIDAAGACLEAAVGKPFEVYLREKILDPLGMKDTTFTPNEEQVKRLVSAYTSDDGPMRPVASGQLVFPKAKTVYPAPGGGLFSTARDMIRFSQMLAHHGTWKGKTLISRKTFDAVFAVKQTPAHIAEPYTCGSWLYGDWFGHEGALRTDQRANLKTGHSRVFFIQTANRAGPAFFQLKRDWHYECDKIQGTGETSFGH